MPSLNSTNQPHTPRIIVCQMPLDAIDPPLAPCRRSIQREHPRVAIRCSVGARVCESAGRDIAWPKFAEDMARRVDVGGSRAKLDVRRSVGGLAAIPEVVEPCQSRHRFGSQPL